MLLRLRGVISYGVQEAICARTEGLPYQGRRDFVTKHSSIHPRCGYPSYSSAYAVDLGRPSLALGFGIPCFRSIWAFAFRARVPSIVYASESASSASTRMFTTSSLRFRFLRASALTSRNGQDFNSTSASRRTPGPMHVEALGKERWRLDR